MKRLLLPLLVAIALPTNQVLGSCKESLKSENYYFNEIIGRKYEMYYAINSDRLLSFQDYDRVGTKCEELQLYRKWWDNDWENELIDNPRTGGYGWYTIICNGENLFSGKLPLQRDKFSEFTVTDKNNRNWDATHNKDFFTTTKCLFDSNNSLAPHYDVSIFFNTSVLPGDKYFHIWTLETRRWQKGIKPNF